MDWGETQNLLSVIIGLNIAYTAFNELRTPHLTRLSDQVTKLRSDIRTRYDELEDEKDWAELSETHAKLSNYKATTALNALGIAVSETDIRLAQLVSGTSSRNFEQLFGIPAVLIAIAGIAVLIHSTLNFKDQLDHRVFWAIVIVGFVPVAAMLLANFLILWKARKIESIYLTQWRKYHDEIFWSIDHGAIAEARYQLKRRRDGLPTT